MELRGMDTPAEEASTEAFVSYSKSNLVSDFN